jgi:S-adenosylmethionine hydrolase
MPALVTLTTDFGQREASVAEVKGVLHSHCPDVRIEDLSHDIARGDVMEAAFFALRAIPRFPAGTIHLVNVAPGPQPMIVSALGQLVVCPDNGVLTMLSHHYDIDAFYGVAIPEELTTQPGQVFFGRDVFAPVLGKLAAGVQPAEVGAPKDGMATLDVPRPEQLGGREILGKIIHVDRFGNLVTNIHVNNLRGFEVQRIEAGDFPLGPLRHSYAEVPPRSPLALVGGAGYVEVAYNNDRADARLGFGRGIKVRIAVAPVT